MGIFKRVHHRKVGIGAKEQGRIAAGQVQVQHQRIPEPGQFGGHVDHRGRRADAPFGPDEHIDFARHRRGALCHQAVDRGLKIAAFDLGNALGDARPHGIEHQRRIQRGRHNDQPGVRVLPFEGTQDRGNAGVGPQIEHHHVRRHARRMGKRGQANRADTVGTHAGGTQAFVQDSILGPDDSD
jgi:hypothetical protein